MELEETMLLQKPLDRGAIVIACKRVNKLPVILVQSLAYLVVAALTGPDQLKIST